MCLIIRVKSYLKCIKLGSQESKVWPAADFLYLIIQKDMSNIQKTLFVIKWLNQDIKQIKWNQLSLGSKVTFAESILISYFVIISQMKFRHGKKPHGFSYIFVRFQIFQIFCNLCNRNEYPVQGQCTNLTNRETIFPVSGPPKYF